MSNKYPSDRIRFKNDSYSIRKDREAFSLYASGNLSLERLCKMLAENNDLPFVTKEQAINEYMICGWDKTI